MKEAKLVRPFLEALEFAAYHHRFDKTKSEEPYINHVINVCNLISAVGNVTDPQVLAAAALHDVLERTNTRPSEINFQFGSEIYHIVLELTDHASDATAKYEQQLRRVDSLSSQARIIKLADKISNVQSLISFPPAGWDIEKRSLYINWADRIVAALHGTNENLEEYFDELIGGAAKNNLYIPDAIHAEIQAAH